MNQIPISGLFLGGLTSYAAAGLFGLAAYQHRRATRYVFCWFACLGALLEGIASLAAILDAHETLISIPSGVPFLQYTFRLDPMSCYFSLALAVVSLAVSVYSLGYLDGFDVRKPLGIFCFFYSLLLISLTVVFTASNAFLFLIAWEVMATTTNGMKAEVPEFSFLSCRMSVRGHSWWDSFSWEPGPEASTSTLSISSVQR